MKLTIKERKLLDVIRHRAHIVSAANGFARDAIGDDMRVKGHMDDAKRSMHILIHAIYDFDPDHVFKGGM